MKNDTRRVVRGGTFWGVVALISSVLLCPSGAAGQSAGNNAVYNPSGTCSPTCAASSAFIDASVFLGTGNNQSPTICGAIYGILSGKFYNYPGTGAVIDARGISGTAALTCAAGTTPWNNGTTAVTVPSTILLPAGTIVISKTWNLPPSTHLIGVGSNIPSTGFTPGTTLVAPSGFSGSAMMSFCTTACTGIGVENLTLNGQGQAIDGIDNANAQDLTYVDHVGLYRILENRAVGFWQCQEFRGAGPLVAIKTCFDHKNGCPTRRDVRRVGTTDPDGGWPTFKFSVKLESRDAPDSNLCHPCFPISEPHLALSPQFS